MDPNNRPDHYNLPDPSTGNPLEAVSKNSLLIRLNPMSWPEGADVTVHHKEHQAFNDAIQAFADFEKFSEENAKNKHLSPAGMQAMTAQFARKVIEPLQKKLDKLTEESAPLRTGPDALIEAYMGKHAAPPTEPNDIALAAEARALIRSLPENQRTTRAMALIKSGDTLLAQAVMHAPAWMTGVNQDFIRQVQIEMVQRTNPRGYAAFKTGRDVALMTRRALDGAIRYIGAETKTLAELRAKKPETTEAA